MAIGFPLYIDLKDNNCTIFGGGEDAYEAAVTLRRFHAKITVISPTICEQLQQMDDRGEIRYLRRKYFRGDCSSARLCVALTEDPSLNVSISDECKNKSIPVAVNKPQGFGTFTMPRAAIVDDVVVTVSGSASEDVLRHVTAQVDAHLNEWIEQNNTET